jgi:uncharacterized phage protein gp47/JayE
VPQPVPASYPVMQVPTAIDYTSKDYAAFVQSMLAYAAQIFPQWNTASEGDIGVAILETVAYACDILSYYGDRITQEAYLPTATQRVSLLNIAKLLGYIVSNGSPAAGTVTFATEANWPATTVPAGTQVATSVPVQASPLLGGANAPAVYQTTQDAVVPANGGTITVPVTQGITYTMTPLGTSAGTVAQVLAIPQLGVLGGSVTVYVQDATDTGITAWNYYAFLVDAGPEDLAFTTYTDQAGQTWVQFGDGLNGLIPPLGMNIYATYTVTAGAAGNVAAGVVSALVTPITGVSIQQLPDGSYNSTAMTGGADPESNDAIRANAPLTFTTQNRAVSAEDFANLALNVPGVLMATAVGNHSTSVALYVLGPNYQAPGPGLVADILAYFQGKTLAGVSLSVLAPAVIPVDVGSAASPVQLYVLPNYAQQSVQDNVQAALQAFLSPPSQQFGSLITVSALYLTVMSVAGVGYCIIPVFTREDTVQSGTASIQMRPTEIAAPGSFYFAVSGGLGSTP